MKNVKISKTLCLLAYPIAYFFTAVFGALHDYIKVFMRENFPENTALIISQLIPSVGVDASILSIVICINVFSVLLWCTKEKKAG